MYCSFIFSGIWILSGIETNVPCINSSFHVIHSYTFDELVNDPVIDSTDLDFSLTAIISPGFKLYYGIFTIPPLTVICLCDTSCLAPLLEFESPIL